VLAQTCSAFEYFFAALSAVALYFAAAHLAVHPKTETITKTVISLLVG